MKTLITRLATARHYALSVISVVCLVWLAQPGYRLDRTWSDLNLMAHAKPASQEFVLLQITEEDLQTLGGSPVSRDVFARALERLHDAGVSRVLIDTSFVSEMDPKDDLRLKRAFEKLGPERVAFDAGLGLENAIVPARFAEHVTLVDTRLMTDKDRRTRAVVLPAFDAGANPSRWLATGELDSRPIRFDLRVDPQSFQRLTIVDALDSDLTA
jgi:Predicted transmembrane sensor domain